MLPDASGKSSVLNQRTRRFCSSRPTPSMPSGSQIRIMADSIYLFFARLTNLTADNFVRVLDALALIRLRSALISDVRCELSDGLFINPLDSDHIALDLGGDAFGICHLNGMGIS